MGQTLTHLEGPIFTAEDNIEASEEFGTLSTLASLDHKETPLLVSKCTEGHFVIRVGNGGEAHLDNAGRQALIKHLAYMGLEDKLGKQTASQIRDIGNALMAKAAKERS